jgi:hypothetical protein
MHLAALEFAPMLARLYVARDRDAAGRMAAERLHARGGAAGIDVRDLVPVWGDFNQDLCRSEFCQESGCQALYLHAPHHRRR